MAVSPRSRTLLNGAAWIVVLITVVAMLGAWPSADQWRYMASRDITFPLGLLFLSFLFVSVLRSLRWRLLIHEEINAGWLQTVFAFFWCFFLSAFTPFRLGEISRPLWVRRKGGSALFASGTLVVERLTDVVTLLIVLGLVVVFAPMDEDWISTTGAGLIACVVTGYIALILLTPRFHAGLNKHAESPGYPDDGLAHRVLVHATSLTRGILISLRRNVFVQLNVLTTVIWATLFAAYYLVLHCLLGDIHWTAPAAVLIAVNLTGFISLSPGNIGLYQLASIGVLAAYGVSGADALLVSILMHGTVLVAISVLGIVGKLGLWRLGQPIGAVL